MDNSPWGVQFRKCHVLKSIDFGLRLVVDSRPDQRLGSDIRLGITHFQARAICFGTGNQSSDANSDLLKLAALATFSLSPQKCHHDSFTLLSRGQAGEAEWLAAPGCRGSRFSAISPFQG